MADFEFDFGQSDEEKLLSDLMSMGANLDFLNRLDPQQAKIVVAGLAKAANRILRPDAGSLPITITGLPDVADINRIEADFSALPDQKITAMLGEASTMAAYDRAITQSQDVAEKEKIKREEIATLFINSLRDPERLANNMTGRLLIEVGGGLTDSQDVIDVTMVGGQVTECYRFSPRSNLYSNLDERTRTGLTKFRNNVDDPESVVLVDKQSSSELLLEEGWYHLVNAVSKNNPLKKALAVKTYNHDSPDWYEETSLEGARLLGCYHMADLSREGMTAGTKSEIDAGLYGESEHSSSLARLTAKEARQFVLHADILPAIAMLTTGRAVFWKRNKMLLGGKTLSVVETKPSV